MGAIGAPARKRQLSFSDDDGLQSHEIPSYKDGYNSYTQTRSQARDTEVTGGVNSRPDDNGAMSDRAGKAVASPQFQAGYQVAALGLLKTASLYTKLALCGTGMYSFTDATSSLLTGFTFTPAAPYDCRIFQALGRAYVCNGTDQPYYTTNGTSLTLQSGAFPYKYGTFYNQRIYCVRPQYPDRVYFSNPLKSNATTTGSEPAIYDVGDFGTFSVNLAASPIQNAGFIILAPDSGVVITNVSSERGTTGIDSVFIETLEHGTWEITAQAALNTNGTVSHNVKQITRSGGCPATLSVFTSDNDRMFFGGDNLYKLAEVANYQSLRTDPESGRVQSDMRSIPAALRKYVVGVYFKNSDYVFYANGSYNDRTLVKDKILKAWSVPYTGWNVSCAMVYRESDGRERLLAGSSDVSDPRIYELEIGDTDAGALIPSSFRDKNSDCGYRGQKKEFDHTRVFYSQIVGELIYEAYLDGVLVKTDTISATSSNPKAVGVGSQAVGQGLVGRDAVGAASTLAVLTDSYFVVELDGLVGEKLEFVYKKTSTGSQYRILGRKTWFELSDISER